MQVALAVRPLRHEPLKRVAHECDNAVAGSVEDAREQRADAEAEGGGGGAAPPHRWVDAGARQVRKLPRLGPLVHL
eukprot:3636924-Prymnesium_polylepis.1